LLENQTLELDTLHDLYNEWFDARLKDIDRLEEIKSNIDDIVKHLKGYIFTHPDYWLISLGHDLIFDRIDEAAVSLDQLDQFDCNELNTKYQFYYYIFKGTFYLSKGEPNEALKYFQAAREKLSSSSNKLEMAEYYFKLGSIYYHLRKTIDSLHNISSALSLFKTKSGYERRIAACEIALGLNSVDLHQWEEAEERFYNALNYANKVADTPMKALIYHDLGLLYAEQNMSKAAIHWLTESMTYNDPDHKTIYLICREYFKLDQSDKAVEWLDRGIELATRQNLSNYKVRFNILRVLYMEKDEEAFERTLKEGIQFFIEEKTWNYVEGNAKYLADFYAKKENYKEAVNYYQLMIKAQNKIFEMEALK